MTVDPTIEGLFVRRRFAAMPERVFDAWVDPALARYWLFTEVVGEIAELRIDARPGGIIQAAGSRHRGFGEVLEVDRPRRLVLTFGVPALGPSVDRLVIDFAPEGEGCVVSVTKQGLPPELADETEGDWGLMFDRLERLLAG